MQNCETRSPRPGLVNKESQLGFPPEITSIIFFKGTSILSPKNIVTRLLLKRITIYHKLSFSVFPLPALLSGPHYSAGYCVSHTQQAQVYCASSDNGVRFALGRIELNALAES